MTVTVAHEPLYRTAPDCRRSYGDLARRLATDLGWVPDDEQQFLLDRIFDERAPGMPTSPEVCVIAPRQNLKSATLAIAALTDLCVLGLPALWTAHLTATSTKSFEDMQARLRANEQYAGLVEFKQGRGEEKIIMRDTEVSLEFRARHGGGGRGFTVPRVTLDEALYLRPSDIGALGPTMVTRRDMQVRYGSSAGLTTSEVLRGLRERGRAGTDAGLTYVEYGAPERACEQVECLHQPDTPGCALDDRELWWRANCALWAGRITEDSLVRQRQMMSKQPREFSREFLSWWEDPPNEDGGAFDLEKWGALHDPAERGSALSFAVATAPDRSRSSIAAAWLREDDITQVELVDYHAGAAWVEARAKALRERWGARLLVTNAARGLVPDAVEPSPAEQAQAHNALADAIEAGTVRHGNQPALNVAVSGSKWRPYGDTRLLIRRGGTDISPIDAAALALWQARQGRDADFFTI